MLNVSTTRNKGNHSFLERDGTAPGVRVSLSTLDKEFLDDDSRLDGPVLVKIDVEGYEHFVIEGGQTWLGRLADAAVMCEMSPDLLTKCGKSVDGILALLRESGFSRFSTIVDPDTISDEGAIKTDFYNVLFCKGARAEAVLASMDRALFMTGLPRGRS